MRNNKTIYWLDKKERIIEVSANWDQFALENDGEKSLAENIKGKPIWNFIRGDVTKIWFQSVLSLVKLRKSFLERPYRCDSPTMKRFMNLKIVPEENDLYRFEHILLYSEPHINPIYFNAAIDSAVMFHKKCSICGKIYNGEDWIEPETLGKTSGERAYKIWNVIYSVCESCFEGVRNRTAIKR